jgi:hypothetical protein
MSEEQYYITKLQKTPQVKEWIKNRRLKPMLRPRVFNVDWQFKPSDLPKFAAGHIPDDMGDHWKIYFDYYFVYFLRSWTGIEIFRLPLLCYPNGDVLVQLFLMETSPKRITLENEEATLNFTRHLVNMIRGYLNVHSPFLPRIPRHDKLFVPKFEK